MFFWNNRNELFSSLTYCKLENKKKLFFQKLSTIVLPKHFYWIDFRCMNPLVFYYLISAWTTHFFTREKKNKWKAMLCQKIEQRLAKKGATSTVNERWDLPFISGWASVLSKFSSNPMWYTNPGVVPGRMNPSATTRLYGSFHTPRKKIELVWESKECYFILSTSWKNLLIYTQFLRDCSCKEISLTHTPEKISSLKLFVHLWFLELKSKFNPTAFIWVDLTNFSGRLRC